MSCVRRRTDRASLLLHVDRATAFAALTDRDALEAWLAPEGMTGRLGAADHALGITSSLANLARHLER